MTKDYFQLEKLVVSQCCGPEIINYGSGSSHGKSKILYLDPDPGNHPIMDPDPTSEQQIEKRNKNLACLVYFVFIRFLKLFHCLKLDG